jgi:kumamolisin
MASNYAKIYNYPASPTTPIVFGVVSLSGSLYGKYNATTGVLTDGDVQNYWNFCGIIPTKYPKVVVVPVAGGRLVPTAYGTDENTLDVATIGACCPGSNVTIVLYVAPNTIAGFAAAFRAAINGVPGKSPKSNIISCSWGAPEKQFTPANITTIETVLASASAAGIPVCAASGDEGASNGLSGLNVDYPGSSPYVVSCGGTTLVCPNLVYDGSTVETAWSYTARTGGGGGGYSNLFAMPAWQSALKSSQAVLNASTKRAVPDVVMNADPNTGVKFLVGCKSVVYGGTSIVAPAMAALIGCMNIPAFTPAKLYSSVGSYHDILSGNNGGYAAGSGYDCSTGLGSPNGLVLAAALAPPR